MTAFFLTNSFVMYTIPVNAVCHVPVMPVRKSPDHRAEQVTQVLYGEKLEIYNDIDEWIYVRSEWDQYEGYANKGQVSKIDLKPYNKPLKYLNEGVADFLFNEQGKTLLPLGSSLFLLKKNQCVWDPNRTTFKGKKIAVSVLAANSENAYNWALKYYGAPYLWGGRSSLGIDCSGLTQMVYKLMGVRMPRDAYQQAEQGETIVFLQEAQCGDLAFFENEEGRITHVGMLLNNREIIHATATGGGVVIDHIDNEGIISKLLKKRTHRLRIIKRYF